MFSLEIPDYSSIQWTVLCASALLVGINKTGLPGIGIINVPVMAIIFPAKISTGLLLPILATADIFAVAYYRRHARWEYIIKLLPWALLGICSGSVVIKYITDEQLKPFIGIIVLVMLVLNYWWNRKKAGKVEIPTHWTFAAGMGFAAGFTTQVANAAGPIMVIYLMAMNLPKNEFIGTGAWYFLILNWLKMGLFAMDGRISGASITADIMIIPFIMAGCAIGIIILNKVPQKYFDGIVQILCVLAALKLSASITQFF